ncbi:hypothetical protein F383_17395 [Gossypium arboreum]|uniref:Uncharacterized protein n=1 Tax=Gossypium arboreum TaxID=29729 RepID=A0A0B0NT45_GOSAR|nr:hypothetical protein F383_17395 [Gossypium arboreum]
MDSCLVITHKEQQNTRHCMLELFLNTLIQTNPNFSRQRAISEDMINVFISCSTIPPRAISYTED